MDNSLAHRLESWDGKHVDYLEKLYLEELNNPEFMEEVIHCYSQFESLQKASSWLIKHHYDQGNSLSDAQITRVLAMLGQLRHWESLLHVLQLIPSFQVTKIQTESIEPVVHQALSTENKFVKAAAYAAYFELVKVIPALLGEFKVRCEDALEYESASIKVKVRKILKALKEIASGL